MPLKPASTSGNRALVCGISPSPPTQPRSELAAAAKSSSSTSKPPRAAKMGRRKAQSEGHLPVLLGVLVAQHGRPAKRIPTLRPLILSRLARPPPRLAACLGLSCPLVRGGARVPPGTRLFANRVSPTSWTGCFFCPRFHLGAPGCPLSRSPSRWAILSPSPSGGPCNGVGQVGDQGPELSLGGAQMPYGCLWFECWGERRRFN